jgi:integrase
LLSRELHLQEPGSSPDSRPLRLDTEQEIVALLKATDNLLPVGGLRPLTYRTLFGLLAAAGLRISEALHLKPQDVDLEHELLTVRQTKFRKSRLVPLDSTVVAALARYAGARRRKLSGQTVDAFFVSDRGKPLPNRTVHSTFERLRARLEWVARGGHASPRLHDLRHRADSPVMPIVRDWFRNLPIWRLTASAVRWLKSA